MSVVSPLGICSVSGHAHHVHARPVPSSQPETLLLPFPRPQGNAPEAAGRILVKPKFDHAVSSLKILPFLSFSLRVKGAPSLPPCPCLFLPSNTVLAVPECSSSQGFCNCYSCTWNVLPPNSLVAPLSAPPACLCWSITTSLRLPRPPLCTCILQEAGAEPWAGAQGCYEGDLLGGRRGSERGRLREVAWDAGLPRGSRTEVGTAGLSHCCLAGRRLLQPLPAEGTC